MVRKILFTLLICNIISLFGCQDRQSKHLGTIVLILGDKPEDAIINLRNDGSLNSPEDIKFDIWSGYKESHYFGTEMRNVDKNNTPFFAVYVSHIDGTNYIYFNEDNGPGIFPRLIIEQAGLRYVFTPQKGVIYYTTRKNKNGGIVFEPFKGKSELFELLESEKVLIEKE